MKDNSWDFFGGPVSKALRSPHRRPGFNPCSGNYISYAATKSSHATTKTPYSQINTYFFNGGASGKEPACRAGEAKDMDLTPGSGRCPGGGHGHTL